MTYAPNSLHSCPGHRIISFFSSLSFFGYAAQGTTTHMIGCGPHPAVTIAFFLSYLMMSSFILINIFVAIIVDSVSAHYKVLTARLFRLIYCFGWSLLWLRCCKHQAWGCFERSYISFQTSNWKNLPKVDRSKFFGLQLFPNFGKFHI